MNKIPIFVEKYKGFVIYKVYHSSVDAYYYAILKGCWHSFGRYDVSQVKSDITRHLHGSSSWFRPWKDSDNETAYLLGL